MCVKAEEIGASHRATLIILTSGKCFYFLLHIPKVCLFFLQDMLFHFSYLRLFIRESPVRHPSLDTHSPFCVSFSFLLPVSRQMNIVICLSKLSLPSDQMNYCHKLSIGLHFFPRLGLEVGA